MKKSKCLLLSQIIVAIFLIPVFGLLGNPANFFGQASLVVAAQAPVPETSPTPTPTLVPDDFIIPNGIEVITDYLNLREGPSLGSSVIDVLQGGEVLTITNLSPNLHWIEILTADDRAGWVSSAPEFVSLNTIVDEPLASVVQPIESAPVLLASSTSGGERCINRDRRAEATR
jgi:hypothetical protein